MPAPGLLRRLFASKSRPLPRPPEGVTVYAVGDVHGRSDLLRPLITAILEDIQTTDGQALILFLGDFVDRGLGSREVVDQLLKLADNDAFETRFLRGNHDESLLEFLFNPSTGPTWCDFGGRETLVSYGVQPPTARSDAEGWAEAAGAFAKALPADHRRFFETLELSWTAGDYFFAHAGVRPGVPLDAQTSQDLLWIREPFLSDTRRLAKVIVHGHTPSEAVQADARRIGIDTGAYATHVLTVLRLSGEDRSLMQTQRGPDRAWRVVARRVGETSARKS
jgi:serine/threonine protein phosphatase 1